MEPKPPFWFHQRQGQLEAAGPELFRVTAPNLGEAFIGIRKIDEGRWRPIFRLQSDGADVDVPDVDLESAPEAWEAAFELYRRRMVV